MQGYKKNYHDPSSVGMPNMITLPGEKDVFLSTEVEDYVTDELYYYLDIYTKHKYLGEPFSGGWTEYPEWYSQLIIYFDQAKKQIENDVANKAWQK